MHRSPSIYFLTFVLGCALLAPAVALATVPSPSPDFVEPDAPAAPSTIDPVTRGTLDVTKVPPPPANPAVWKSSEYFYRYRHAITLRIGPVVDTKTTGSGPQTLLGALYLFSTQDLKSYEAGAEMLGDGTGAMHFAQRFIYSRTRFRPYLKAGGGVRVVPKDQLATFIKYENYQIRGAGGFEYIFDVFGKELNFRLETELAASTASFQGGATLGYVWAW